MENNYNMYNGQPQGQRPGMGQYQGMGGGAPYQNPRPQNSGKTSYAAIAAICAAAYCLLSLIVYQVQRNIYISWIFRNSQIFCTIMFGFLLPLGLFAVIAVFLFLKKNSSLIGILFCVLAGSYLIYTISVSRHITYYLTFGSVLLLISRLAVAAAWAVLGIWMILQATAKENGFVKFVAKYWYLPSCIYLIARVIELFAMTYTFISFLGWWISVAVYGALAALVVRWVMNPEELTLRTSAPTVAQGYYGNPGQNPYQGNPGRNPYPGNPYQGNPGQNPYQGNPGQNPYQGYPGNPGQNPYQSNPSSQNQEEQGYSDQKVSSESPESSEQNPSGQDGKGAAATPCPKCGQPIPAEDRFCTNCGYQRS